MKHRIRDISSFLILCLSSIVASASDNPVYLPNEQQLLVPVVDVDSLPGKFQNVVIEFAQGDLWRLVDFWDATPIQNVDSVDIVRTSTLPVQVFLRVNGTFTSGCERYGKSSQIWNGNELIIFSYYEPVPSDVTCTANVTEYSQIVAASVYGKSAGTYNVTFNGNSVGTFTLDSDNHLE